MTALAYYLLKVVLCSGILFGYYLMALRNRRFHQWNRFYLLAAVALSLALPFLEITIEHYRQADDRSGIRLLQAVQSADQYLEEVVIYSSKPRSVGPWLLAGYGLISAVLLGLFAASVFRILRLAKRHTVTLIDRIRFVQTSEPGTPFSFFRYIFWNRGIDLEEPAGQQIFRHELVHVHERHSLDKVLIQIVLVFFWCNPFFWLIRRELKLIHEFIADQRSVGEQGTEAFALMILRSAYSAHFNALTNPFFQTSIKRRLHMLSKKTNPRWQYIGRLIALPVIALTVMAFTIRTKEIPLSVLERPITVVIDAGHGKKPDGAPEGAREGSVLEDEINLDLAKLIQSLNTDPKIRIVLTRPGAAIVDLKRRVEIAREQEADLFLSMHVNHQPNGNDRSGMEFYLPSDDAPVFHDSRLLASALAEELGRVYKVNKELKSARTAPIYVLRNAPCPAVLLEVGYLSNAADRRFISDRKNQEAVARQILNAIVRFAAQRQDMGAATGLPLADTAVTPRYYVNGKPATSAEVEQIDPDAVDRVNVLKSADAAKAYGKEGASGIVEIYTKPGARPNDSRAATGKTSASDAASLGRVTMRGLDQDLYYVLNGEPVTAGDVNKLHPNSIQSVNVLKGEAAVKKYGEKAQKGALEIQTKNGLTQTGLQLPQADNSSPRYDTIPKKRGIVYKKAETGASIDKSVWREFLEKNLQPLIEHATSKGMPPGQYTVLTQFIVELDGSLSDLRTVKDPGYDLGTKTRELIASSPKWTPARQNGKPVRSFHTQPVTFVIAEE